jgi:hypothetical protein
MDESTLRSKVELDNRIRESWKHPKADVAARPYHSCFFLKSDAR